MNTREASEMTSSVALLPGWPETTVAANLLMAVLLVGGLITGLQLKQEVFPEFSLDMVTVSIAYPGASPEEVEKRHYFGCGRGGAGSGRYR